MPLAKRRFSPVAPVPVRAPPSNSQISARPEGALALAVIARPFGAVRAVKQGRVLAQTAVEVDQRALGQFLAAAACNQHLAFGDDRGCEIQHDRPLPLA